jgi:hypothetical protein
MKHFDKFITGTVILYILIDFFWGKINLDTLPSPLGTIIELFLGPLFIISIVNWTVFHILWKIKYFEKLSQMLFDTNPAIYGTWAGTIKYKYHTEQEKSAFLIITQPDAYTIHCRLFTDERESTSETTSFLQNADSKKLIYTYKADEAVENKEKNEMHMGVTELKLSVLNGYAFLNGFYCTDRKTRGSITLKRISKKCATSYQDAQNFNIRSK